MHHAKVQLLRKGNNPKSAANGLNIYNVYCKVGNGNVYRYVTMLSFREYVLMYKRVLVNPVIRLKYWTKV